MTEPLQRSEVRHDPASSGPEEQVGLPSTVLSTRLRMRSSLALPVIAVIAVITFGGAAYTSGFLSGATWINILRTASFTSIVACFEGLVMISGGLDLSVGSTFLAGAMVSAAVANSGQSDVVSILATVGVGVGIGAVNGLLANTVASRQSSPHSARCSPSPRS